MATASNKVANAGDVDVDEVTLVSVKGFAQTITPQIIGIEIFEDLFAPFTTGKLIIRDSQDLTNLMPLIGEELVRLKIITPSLGEQHAFKGEFIIFKMEDRVKTLDREVIYTLHFISKEAIVDVNKKISRGFSGKVSDIMNKILTEDTNLGTKKEVNIEDTKNAIKYVSNFWTVTKNIQYLCDSAVNTGGSPSYVFFESKYALNFISLDTMYKGLPIFQRFISDNYSAESLPLAGSGRSVEQDYQRILELHTPQSYNYIDRLKSGLYGSEILYMDLMTKQYVHHWYKPKFEDGNHLNEYPLWRPEVIARPKAVLIHDHTYYNNYDGYDDVTNSKIIQKRKSLLAQAEANKITIVVYGRTDYSVGQKVRVEIPRATQIKAGDPNLMDGVLSGNYLIGALRHVISRRSHQCVLELIKDSYMVDINDPK